MTVTLLLLICIYAHKLLMVPNGNGLSLCFPVFLILVHKLGFRSRSFISLGDLRLLWKLGLALDSCPQFLYPIILLKTTLISLFSSTRSNVDSGLFSVTAYKWRPKRPNQIWTNRNENGSQIFVRRSFLLIFSLI